MIGHRHIVEDFISLSRRDAMGHGYIFYGPSMVGKRTFAASLGQFLERGSFDAAAPAADGPHDAPLQDLLVIDADYMRSLDPDASGTSIGIDAVREAKNFLWQRPNSSPRRTLVIDRAELLTTEAQNALLKITEEPPASSLLILVTSDLESILPTIISRLPKIYFGMVPQAEIAEWAAGTLGIAKPKAQTLAKQAMGKPGIAWRMLNDEQFRDDLTCAEQFLKTSAAGRRDFVKKLIEPDDFSLRRFLDALILVLAWERPSKTKSQFWHKTVKLYDGAANFGLNPRLQLEALMK